MELSIRLLLTSVIIVFISSGMKRIGVDGSSLWLGLSGLGSNDEHRNDECV